MNRTDKDVTKTIKQDSCTVDKVTITATIAAIQ